MSKSATLYMETTEVPVEKTASEICSVLVRAGASRISMDYGLGGKVLGLHFVLRVGEIPVPFALPVRVDPIYRLFLRRRGLSTAYTGAGAPYHDKFFAQAERVAWRQLLRWIQAQVAMVECGMVQAVEVFLPYLINDQGVTMFQQFADSGLKMIAGPKS